MKQGETIRSRGNARFKRLRELLGSARERHRAGQTILDGPHLVEAYLARCGRPALIAVSEDARDNQEIARLLARASDCEVLGFAPDLFGQLSPVRTPTGILALIDIPAAFEPDTLEDVIVLLDGVQDPGNVGAIIRSAAAASAGAVLLGPQCADPWSPRVLRSAMGGHFALAVRAAADPVQSLQSFRGRIFAAEGRGGVPPYAHDLTGPVAFVFGAEGRGLGTALSRSAHARISIPLGQGIESLNVAAAAAIILFERVRQLSQGTSSTSGHP